MIDQIKDLDTRDEKQILADLAGETLQDMIYSTNIKDRKSGQWVPQVRLSWAGTKEAARSKGNIMVDDAPIVTDLEDSIRIVVRVTDLSKNFTIFGGCHQPKKQKVFDVNKTTGEVLDTFRQEDDPFCFQKGLSKAQRNAIQTVLPADYLAKCIDRFLKLSGKLQITKPANTRDTKPRTPAPPPASSIKPRSEWEKVTEDMVPDYPHLETLIWNMAKIQPKEMYAELGGGSRSEMTVPAWESFLVLKERYAPAEPPPETKSE